MHTFEGAECFGIDFSTNEARPYFGAAFSDGYVRIWNLQELTGSEGANIAKPKFEIEHAVELGPVDLRFNPLGNRIAVSSVDNSLKVYNLRDDQAPSLLAESSEVNAFKLDFSPDGSEILTGQLGLRTIDT